MPPIKAAFQQVLPISLRQALPLTPRNKSVSDKSSTPRPPGHCNIAQVLLGLLQLADCPTGGSPTFSHLPLYHPLLVSNG